MRSRFILLFLVSKLLNLLLLAFYLSSQSNIRLNSLSQIQIPDLNFRQEGRDNRIVSFFGLVGVDRPQINFQPLDVQRKSRQHYLMMHKQIALLLLIHIHLQERKLLLLHECKGYYLSSSYEQITLFYVIVLPLLV